MKMYHHMFWKNQEGQKVVARVRAGQPRLDMYGLTYPEKNMIVAEQVKEYNPQWLRLGVLVIEVFLWFLNRKKMPGFIEVIQGKERLLYYFTLRFEPYEFEYGDKGNWRCSYAPAYSDVQEQNPLVEAIGKTEKEAKKNLYIKMESLGYFY